MVQIKVQCVHLVVLVKHETVSCATFSGKYLNQNGWYMCFIHSCLTWLKIRFSAIFLLQSRFNRPSFLPHTIITFPLLPCEDTRVYLCNIQDVTVYLHREFCKIRVWFMLLILNISLPISDNKITKILHLIFETYLTTVIADVHKLVAYTDNLLPL